MTRRGYKKHGAVLAIGIPLVCLSLLTTADWIRVGDEPSPCRLDKNSATFALVLSGGPNFRRTRHAVSLYRAGRVAEIVFSGAGYGGDSAHNLAAEARRLDVPNDRIVIEDRARSTADNFRFVCALPDMARTDRIAIVTDRHHIARAFATAQRQCPNHHWCSSSAPTPVTLTRRFSETMKWLAYQLLGRAPIG